MAWRQLVFRLGVLDIAELVALLVECGVQAISLSNASDQPIFESGRESPELLFGTFEEQDEEIRSTYSRWFTIESESRRDRWLCLHAVRTE